MSTPDIYTTVSPTGRIGGRDVFEFVDGDLVDDDLQELITQSLITWRRARPEDPVPEGMGRQGWFADPEFGSRVWLLSYSRVGPGALADARLYAEEALAWMVEGKIIGAIAVTAEFAPDRRGVLLGLTVSRPLQPDARIRYAYLWSTPE